MTNSCTYLVDTGICYLWTHLHTSNIDSNRAKLMSFKHEVKQVWHLRPIKHIATTIFQRSNSNLTTSYTYQRALNASLHEPFPHDKCVCLTCAAMFFSITYLSY